MNTFQDRAVSLLQSTPADELVARLLEENTKLSATLDGRTALLQAASTFLGMPNRSIEDVPVCVGYLARERDALKAQVAELSYRVEQAAMWAAKTKWALDGGKGAGRSFDEHASHVTYEGVPLHRLSADQVSRLLQQQRDIHGVEKRDPSGA